MREELFEPLGMTSTSIGLPLKDPRRVPSRPRTRVRPPPS
ncbi:hypothetical protein [Bradyrhizobium sp. ERR14]|nr:CubicO group peptidase (beta-lactamase class C family) [Bradyrhizobium sp. ERR14]